MNNLLSGLCPFDISTYLVTQYFIYS